MYSAEVLRHFESPHGAGHIENPTATVEVQNPACGDVLRLSLRCDGNTITAATFRAKGCVPVIACASKLVEMLQGASIANVAAITREQLVLALGGLPQASEHASTLAIDALRQALAEARSQ